MDPQLSIYREFTAENTGITKKEKKERSSRPPSPFPDLCYVDATPGAVEGREQRMT